MNPQYPGLWYSTHGSVDHPPHQREEQNGSDEGTSEGLRRLSRCCAGAGADDARKLRQVIRTAVPDATETISYRLPTFQYKGKPLVALGASRDHCSLYLMGYVPAELEADLAKYDTGKGTIRFPADRPLPESLVRKVVRTRIGLIESGKGYRARS